jgi:hypothetical protein
MVDSGMTSEGGRMKNTRSQAQPVWQARAAPRVCRPLRFERKANAAGADSRPHSIG